MQSVCALDFSNLWWTIPIAPQRFASGRANPLHESDPIFRAISKQD
jgi:hypothetical protein